MKHVYWLLLISTPFADAQKLKKADLSLLSNLETHINYLSSDLLAGRRMGTEGEKLAYQYISNQFEKAGLLPKGDKESYLQQFEINEGKEISAASYLIIDGNYLTIQEDYFPLAFSAHTGFEAMASISLRENLNPWFYDIKELLENNANNPHFNIMNAIKIKTIAAAKKGASALIVYNTSAINDALKFEPKLITDLVNIPVIYIAAAAGKKYLKDETATLDMKCNIKIADKKSYGTNVIGYINNNAATTIVIGAHYDHLGYGEDHNSLYTGTVPQIHHGADDNASGTSGVIELGKMMKSVTLKNNNYLLIAFSGEELGLFGSKYFTSHPTIDLTTINYMINMDMIGRLKDSTRAMSIGGYGTSPDWSTVLLKKDKYFKLSFDSSGAGPSDHTSFYRKDIPVLFFFTGTHSDYHKPTDDATKINLLGELQVVKYIYTLVEKTNKKPRLIFTKTREMPMSSTSSFNVSLGIMPDYTFTGAGVKADGVIDGRPADKAGIKTGDIITQLGEYKITDLQTYMQTLNKLNKGDATTVTVKRGEKIIAFDIVF